MCSMVFFRLVPARMTRRRILALANLCGSRPTSTSHLATTQCIFHARFLAELHFDIPRSTIFSDVSLSISSTQSTCSLSSSRSSTRIPDCSLPFTCIACPRATYVAPLNVLVFCSSSAAVLLRVAGSRSPAPPFHGAVPLRCCCLKFCQKTQTTRSTRRSNNQTFLCGFYVPLTRCHVLVLLAPLLPTSNGLKCKLRSPMLDTTSNSLAFVFSLLHA